MAQLGVNDRNHDIQNLENYNHIAINAFHYLLYYQEVDLGLALAHIIYEFMNKR